MRLWIVVVLLLIFLVIALVIVWVLAKTRLELSRLRRVARDHTQTLLRIDSLAIRTHGVVVLQGLRQQRIPTVAAELDVTESPSGPWPSLETL